MMTIGELIKRGEWAEYMITPSGPIAFCSPEFGRAKQDFLSHKPHTKDWRLMARKSQIPTKEVIK